MENYEKERAFCEANGIRVHETIEWGKKKNFPCDMLSTYSAHLIESGQHVEAEKAYTFDDMRESWIQSSKNKTRKTITFKDWIRKYKSGQSTQKPQTNDTGRT